MPLVPEKDWVPVHSVRVANEIWFAAKRAAADRGETITDVIVRALVRYVREWPGEDADDD